MGPPWSAVDPACRSRSPRPAQPRASPTKLMKHCSTQRSLSSRLSNRDHRDFSQLKTVLYYRLLSIRGCSLEISSLTERPHEYLNDSVPYLNPLYIHSQCCSSAMKCPASSRGNKTAINGNGPVIKMPLRSHYRADVSMELVTSSQHQTQPTSLSSLGWWGQKERGREQQPRLATL